MSSLDERLKDQLDYSIALQRAIRYHCQGQEVMPYIAERCPHHAEMLNKSLGRHTKEEIEMLSQTQVEQLHLRVTGNEESVGRLAVRFNTHAKDITELTCRIEELEDLGELAQGAQGFLELARRIEELKIVQAGNDRTFGEVVSGLAKVAHLADRLFTRQRCLPELARRVEKLAERIKKLEEREAQ